MAKYMSEEDATAYIDRHREEWEREARAEATAAERKRNAMIVARRLSMNLGPDVLMELEAIVNEIESPNDKDGS